jgi:hypothetical protein
MLKLSLFYLLIFHSLAMTQEIPNEFFRFKSQKLLRDSGQNWKTHTTFGPLRYQTNNASLPTTHDSLLVQSRLGLYTQNESTALYGYGHFSYKGNFYGYLYPRVVNNPGAFPRYSGQPRDISRGGFNSGETDLAGIGFQNDWLLFQLGRGRQSWGAGNDIQLALSEYSPAYDHGLLSLNFGKFRARYFHGYLESDSVSINRYITGRGVEWSNQRSLVIGLSETVIYSGENRSLDLAYLNPISTHLEIELNNRQNVLGANSGNGVWQASMDWLAKPNLRISGNFLFDEFVLDKVQKDEGKGHGSAQSFKAVYTPSFLSSGLLSFFFAWIRVGSPTFRHGDGNNNFVQRNRPLGWKYGSDGREMKLGMNYFNLKNLIGNLEIGQREIGEKSILNDPYETYTDYLTGQFPSGLVNETVFISGQVQWWWKPNVSLITGLEWSDSNIDGKTIDVHIGVDIYYPKSFKL